MKSSILRYAIFATILFSAVSCSDKDPETDPPGTVTLNMLNEENGKTILGRSEVFINKANNFSSRWNLIADVGKAAGIWMSKAPQLDNLAREVAVIPGNIYQVFDDETVFQFPSGTRAIMTDAAYYDCYVMSHIITAEKVTGAVVKYVPVYPDARGLPEFDLKIGTAGFAGDRVSYELPKGVECFWYDGVPEVFDISVEDGKLNMVLKKTPTDYNGITGNYGIYIRSDNVFTKVLVSVVR